MKNNTANNHILNLRQLSKNLKLLKSSDDIKNILLSYTYKIKTKELLSIYQDMNYLKPNEHKSYWEQSDSNYSHIHITYLFICISRFMLIIIYIKFNNY